MSTDTTPVPPGATRTTVFDKALEARYTRAFIDDKWFDVGHFTTFPYATTGNTCAWLFAAHGVNSGYVDINLVKAWEYV